MPPAKGNSSEVRDPLLPKLASDGDIAAAPGGASVPGAVFNVSTSIVGAGIMSIPAAMRVVGVGPALVLIVAVAVLADSSVEFLLRYTACLPGAPSYSRLMGDSFGRSGAVALNLCIAITTSGILVVYLIIIGDVMSGSVSGGVRHVGVLPEWFGERWWTGREAALLVAVVVFLLPLVLAKRVDSLRFTSALSVLLAVVFVCIISAIALYAVFQGTAKTPRLLPDFAQLSSPFELFTAVPVIVVAFTFHFNVHPIRAELEKTSEMTKAVRISLVLCSLIYAAVGFFGYLLFGDDTMADVLANFDSSSGSRVPQFLNDAARLSYALHIVLVFPLLHFALRLNLDELLFPRCRPLDSDNVRFVCLTGLLLGLSYGAAVAIPSIWTLFQLCGSTTAVLLSLIFPAALVLRDVHGVARRRDKALAAVMIILAVVTSSIAIASNIISLYGNGGKVPSVGHVAEAV